jgi:hypothetical protein
MILLLNNERLAPRFSSDFADRSQTLLKGKSSVLTFKEEMASKHIEYEGGRKGGEKGRRLCLFGSYGRREEKHHPGRTNWQKLVTFKLALAMFWRALLFQPGQGRL